MNKMRMKSKDMQSYNIERLEKLFPEAVTEGKINFEKLRELLSGDISDDREVYDFTWVGKRKAMLESSTPINKTLRPCKEESKNWDSTENLYIEGDNLDVLKLLQESYLSSVKMIYIDPPYNTGNDFIYRDDFKQSADEYAEESGEYNEEGERLFKNTDTNGRFHSDWCSMIYSRLRIARNLLTDDGVIFISIDDNEVENLKKICNEVFGEGNFVAQFPWRKRTAKSDVPFGVSQDYEWVICYCKGNFTASIEGGTRKYFQTDDYPNRQWRIHDLTTQRSAQERPNSNYTMVNPKNGDEYPVNPSRVWAVTTDTFQKYYDEGRIVFPNDYEFLSITRPAFRYFKDDDMHKAGEMFGHIAVSTKLPDDIGMTQDGTKDIADLFEYKVFGFPKPVSFIKYFISISTAFDKDAVILDFFSGSSTAAHAVMQLNAEDGGKRRFIMVQLPEKTDEKSEAYKAGYKTICEIGKERIRRAGDKILSELQKGKPAWADEEVTLDIGFRVFKTDSSNMKDVYYSAAEYDQTLLAALESNIKDDRDDLDLLFGCMLDWGLPLSILYKSEKIGSFTIHTVNNGDLIACFNDEVSEEVVREIAKRTPLRALFRDSSFADSPARINVGEIFKTIAPSTTVKVI